MFGVLWETNKKFRNDIREKQINEIKAAIRKNYSSSLIPKKC